MKEDEKSIQSPNDIITLSKRKEMVPSAPGKVNTRSDFSSKEDGTLVIAAIVYPKGATLDEISCPIYSKRKRFCAFPHYISEVWGESGS